MRTIVDIGKALADKSRVRMLLALRKGELCACQLVELVGLANSTASRHLAVLRQAGLVELRKQGRWVYYRLAGEDAPAAMREAVQWACCCGTDDPCCAADERRLEAILREDPEVICKRQLKRSRCCSSAPATPAAARWPKAGPGISTARRSRRTRPASSRTG